MFNLVEYMIQKWDMQPVTYLYFGTIRTCVCELVKSHKIYPTLIRQVRNFVYPIKASSFVYQTKILIFLWASVSRYQPVHDSLCHGHWPVSNKMFMMNTINTLTQSHLHWRMRINKNYLIKYLNAFHS